MRDGTAAGGFVVGVYILGDSVGVAVGVDGQGGALHVGGDLGSALDCVFECVLRAGRWEWDGHSGEPARRRLGPASCTYKTMNREREREKKKKSRALLPVLLTTRTLFCSCRKKSKRPVADEETDVCTVKPVTSAAGLAKSKSPSGSPM